MAETSRQIHHRQVGRRLFQGLALGALAVGAPALANHWLSKRLAPPRGGSWGRLHSYRWRGHTVAFHRLGPRRTERAPVLLLHGFDPGADSVEWRRAAEALAREPSGRTIYVPDLLGWGLSDRPDDIRYDAALYVDLATDFLRHVIAQPTVVVGSGLSAAHAVAAAVALPERVAALGFACPLGLAGGARAPATAGLGDRLLHGMVTWPVLGTSALYFATSRRQIAHELRTTFFASPERADAAIVDHRWRSSHQPGAHGPIAAHLAGRLRPGEGVAFLLPTLDCPVWLAWGREALDPPVEAADRWLRILGDRSDVELDVFERSAVAPHAEEPERFAERLRRFLERQGVA